jgi:hypothetical protein
MNDVKVPIHGGFSPAGLRLDGTLALINVGGTERALVPMHAPSFARSRLIVAFHDGSERDVIPALEASHSVTLQAGSDDQHAWGIFEPLA